MAEIEHYVDPSNKSHRKYESVKHMKLPLWTGQNQKLHKGVEHDITLEEAVNSRLIDNETLAYFLARTYIFLTTIGVSKSGVRFRQHTEKEMAHYASDCWDAEVETSYGWIEVAGHADRTCYDLSAHAKVSGVELIASKPLPQPIKKQLVRIAMNKGSLYKTFKDKSKALVEYFDGLNEQQKEALLEEFTNNGDHVNVTINSEVIKVTKNEATFERYEVIQTEEKYIPGVIEPSFGIGRITYCVMEHCFSVREKDERRTFFTFPPVVAPYKVSVLPLIHTEEMLKFVEPISKNIF
jgi:glycyl-tRNA synthetase